MQKNFLKIDNGLVLTRRKGEDALTLKLALNFPTAVVRRLPPCHSRPRGNDMTFLLEAFCMDRRALSLRKCLLSSSDVRLDSVIPIRMHLTLGVGIGCGRFCPT